MTKKPKQFIKDLDEKSSVDSLFLIRQKNLGLGKNGRPFLSLQIGDCTGYLDGRIWDRAQEVAAEFEAGDIAMVKGQIQVYQNRKQIIVNKIEKVDSTDLSMNDFVAKSSLIPTDMYSELMQIVQTMTNDQIKRLVVETLEDPEIKPLFLKAPAAKTIHHAWESGLLEHVLSITKILVGIANHYSFLNRDLLIFGAIFHDLGKVHELTFSKTIGYSDRGRLLGHMMIACEIIDKKAARILGFNDELKDILKHIVISHHGKLEYGSPKRPKFIEALIVAMVDDLDSKVTTIRSIMEGEQISGDKWSKFNDMFERYFLLENLKEKF